MSVCLFSLLIPIYNICQAGFLDVFLRFTVKIFFKCIRIFLSNYTKRLQNLSWEIFQIKDVVIYLIVPPSIYLSNINLNANLKSFRQLCQVKELESWILVYHFIWQLYYKRDSIRIFLIFMDTHLFITFLWDLLVLP